MQNMLVILLSALIVPLAVSQYAGNVAAAQEVAIFQAPPEVALYVTAGCPWCKKAVRYLQEKKISFRLYDVEKDPEALQQFLRLNPRGGVPFARIGNRTVLGFSSQTYDQALGLSSE